MATCTPPPPPHAPQRLVSPLSHMGLDPAPPFDRLLPTLPPPLGRQVHPFIIPVPDLSARLLDENDRVLVLATDGVSTSACSGRMHEPVCNSQCALTVCTSQYALASVYWLSLATRRFQPLVQTEPSSACSLRVEPAVLKIPRWHSRFLGSHLAASSSRAGMGRHGKRRGYQCGVQVEPCSSGKRRGARVIEAMGSANAWAQRRRDGSSGRLGAPGHEPMIL